MPDKKTPAEIINMPMIAMRGIVLFPSMILHFDVGRKKSIAALEEAMKGNRMIFLASQINVEEDEIKLDNVNKIGVVAEVRQVIKNNGGTTSILVEGRYRAKLIEVTGEEPFLSADVQEMPLKELRPSRSILCDALMRTVKDLFNEYTYLVPKMPKELAIKAFGMDDPAQFGEFLAGNLNIDIEDKQKILEESNYVKRLEILAGVLENENNILGVEKDIYEKVKEQIDQNQREYYLREQLKAITEELGDGENPMDEADAYRKKIEALGVEGEVKDKLKDYTFRCP